MRYGSVCSGIESASVAWEPMGWSAAWFSEVEPFPSAVLAHRWPHVANLGDMTQLPTLIAAGVVPAPDILVGGTPCQAFSVAGMRKGLDDERGQLTIKYVEVANEIDRARPRGEECIAVWENVPGVLSDKSNAFGCFLGALVGEDDPLEPAGKKWGNAGIVYGPQRIAAWRVLDAQYFGVAQRRRRVFVVASARKGFDPGAVLFESESLRRDTPPSREAGEAAAGNAGGGSYSTSGAGYWRDGVGALRGREQDSHENIIVPAVYECHGQDSRVKELDDVCTTVSAKYGTRGGNVPIVCHGTQDPCVSDKAYAPGRNGGQENVVAIQGSMIGRKEANGPSGNGVNEDVCFTLNTIDRHAVAVRTANTSANGIGVDEELAYTLDGAQGQAVYAVSPHRGAGSSGVNVRETDVSQCLQAFNGGNQGGDYVQSGTTVRRLTPRECERLQGFEDDHTNIPWKLHQECKRKGWSYEEELIKRGLRLKGSTVEDCPDGPRYKAIGNSKAVPVIRWVGLRIKKHLEEI